MKLNYALSAAVTLCSLIVAPIQRITAQVQTARYISMTPNSNGFYEYLPQGYDPAGTQTYPLMIFAHGMGELGNGSPSQLSKVLQNGPPKLINQGTFPTSFVVNGQTYRFIVLSPQFVGWPQPGDINDIINYATQHYKVNVNKVYLTGLSMGGGVTWDYPGTSTVFASRLAALAPIAGASSPENVRARNIAASNLPVWAFHNNGDPTVPVAYTNGYIDEINAPPAPTPLAKKTIFQSNSHDAWSQAYNPSYRENSMNVYEWMLSYQRNYSSNQPPVANAGTDINVSLPSSPVQLNGSNSWDVEGPITAYNWTWISGPAQYNLSNGNIANPVLTNLVAGTYVFRLTVTDNQGATGVDDIIVRGVPVQPVPGRIQGEDFFAMNGVSTEPTGDAGGGFNVSYIDNGDWMDYNLSVASTATYTANFRVAAPTSGAQFQLRRPDGSIITTMNIPATGSWQTWTTITTTLPLTAGNQILRIYSTTSGWNFNWFELLNGAGAGNQLPTANAGSNQTIVLPASTATLTGSGSDPDGTIASYNWTQLSGTAATIVSPNSASTSITGLTTTGARVFRLKVTDNSGGTATADVTITVNPAAGAKAIPGKIEAESYDAMFGIQTENTSDAGGGLNVGYIDNGDWMDYNVTVATTSTYTTGFRVASIYSGAQLQLKRSDGTLLATVTVPNTGGWQTWATVTAPVSLVAGTQTIRVISNTASGWNFNWMDFAISSANQLPTANAGPNQTIVLPASTTTLTGSGSDPDGTIASYNWTQVSGTTATIASPNSASTNITGLTTSGARVFRLTVTDNSGGIATADVTVTVTAASGKLIPGKIEGEDYDQMSGILTEATSDAGGGLNVSYFDNGDWLNYNVTVASAATYTASFRVATINPGAQLQLRRTDGTILATFTVPNTGGWQTWTTVSASVTLPAGAQTIRVHCSGSSLNFNWMDFAGSAANQLPTANAGSNQTIVLPASTATLTGSGSDPDGTIASYNWTQVSGTAATIASPNSASTNITGLTTSGARVFRLKVTDNSGGTATADVTVTVNAPSGKLIPGKIEAEDYDQMSGILTEATSDAGGGLNVSYFDNGDWLNYNVTVASAATYTASFRVATINAGAQLQLRRTDGTILATVAVPNTGGWQTWTTVSASVSLPAGAQTIRVYCSASSLNFNWTDFIDEGSFVKGEITTTQEAKEEPTEGTYFKIFPNPVKNQCFVQLINSYVGKVKIQVIDQSGAIRKEWESQKTQSILQVPISVSGLSSGTYFVRVQAGKWEKSVQIVKL